MSDSEDKYTLAYQTVNDPDPQEPPFKYRTYYLADALRTAFTINESGGRALSIVQGEQVIFGSEALSGMLDRIAELVPLTPERPLREIAAQALEERSQATQRETESSVEMEPVVSETGWISLEQLHPADGQRVLVVFSPPEKSEERECRIAIFHVLPDGGPATYNHHRWFVEGADWHALNCITHWRPLPDLPRKERSITEKRSAEGDKSWKVI